MWSEESVILLSPLIFLIQLHKQNILQRYNYIYSQLGANSFEIENVKGISKKDVMSHVVLDLTWFETENEVAGASLQ